MQFDLPPLPFERPDQPHRDLHPHPHPSREKRPPSIFQSSQPAIPKKGKPSRLAVPFNRLQLAAALIEYHDELYEDRSASEIDWSVQEVCSKPLPQLKKAPNSAIFIPFRQTIPSKRLDFFSGLELPQSPKSPAGQSLSGFGVVSETGASRKASATRSDHQRISQQVVIEDVLANQSTIELDQIDHDVEILSEWGLDKLIPNKPNTTASLPDPLGPTDHSRTHTKAGRLPDQLDGRHQVKSDMFDFHFSELRLHSENQDQQHTTSLTPDFFADKAKVEQSTPIVDDEAMLRQRVGCDPGGRKLFRPQSVMELNETRLLYQHSKTSALVSSKAKQLALTRGRRPFISHQGGLDDRMRDNLTRNPKKSALRTSSLSPSRAVARAPTSSADLTNPLLDSGRQRCVSGTIATFQDPTHEELKPPTRPKSVLDEPSSRRFSLNPLSGVLSKRLHQRTKSSSSATTPADMEIGSQSISLKASTQTDNQEPKPKRRTSADIAERYQQSIAMLEGRKSEDVTYDVPDQVASSFGGSQGLKECEGTTKDDQSALIEQADSNPNRPGNSEFSLGAPKQFTSRFDPKVASVFSQVSPGDSHPGDSESLENQSVHDNEGDENLEAVTDEPIYDEQGRIRFPMSLQPLVLIMPVPLTPAQPESEQVAENDDNESAQAKQAELEDLQKLKQVRPAGKLYGRSLIDELNSRKGIQKAKPTSLAANGRATMYAHHLSAEDILRPGSIYSAVDPVSEVRQMVPSSSNSKLHIANQAVQTTQSRFNQALVNSSKARKSVFGTDMIMHAELEKLKRIKALEEQEFREEKAKLEAKESKMIGKKKGKNKRANEQESLKVEEADERFNRMSCMDWDAMLERETRAARVRQTRIPVSLPVIQPPVIEQNEDLVSDMSSWFKDQQSGSLEHQTPIITPIDLEVRDGFGGVDTLARKLEIQVESMTYKPIENVFNNRQMVRPDSVQSQAAFLSLDTRVNTPNMNMTSPRGLESEENPGHEEFLLNVIPENDRFSRLPPAGLRTYVKEDDDIPLSQHRKPNALRIAHDSEDDDCRPLSQFGAKLTVPSTRSPIPSTSSHDSEDEELPLGIRASILISQKHPPVDLTNDDTLYDGPIGSVSSDESDLMPLGYRASALRPMQPEDTHPSLSYPHLTFGTANNEAPHALAQPRRSPSSSQEDDDVPLGYRASRLPTKLDPLNTDDFPDFKRLLASGSKSIGGQSDDVPLGKKFQDSSLSPSGINPKFSFPIRTNFNNPFQNDPGSSPNHIGLSIMPTQDDDDEDDDIPLARMSSIALSPKVGVSLTDEPVEITKPPEKTNGDREQIAVTPSNIEPFKQTSPPPPPNPEVDGIDKSPRKDSMARQDTLAALEGRSNVEQHADDDVPLGVTRAAHNTTSTLQRERTKKRQRERIRKQNATKAQAEFEALRKNAPTESFRAEPKIEQVKDEADHDDDDDVPLGMNHRPTRTFNLPEGDDEEEDDDVPLGISNTLLTDSRQDVMMRALFEQQNAAFGFQINHQPPPMAMNPYLMTPQIAPPGFIDQRNLLSHPTFPSSSMNFMPLPFHHPQPFHVLPPHQPDLESNDPSNDSSISKWRQDIS